VVNSLSFACYSFYDDCYLKIVDYLIQNGDFCYSKNDRIAVAFVSVDFYHMDEQWDFAGDHRLHYFCALETTLKMMAFRELPANENANDFVRLKISIYRGYFGYHSNIQMYLHLLFEYLMMKVGAEVVLLLNYKNVKQFDFNHFIVDFKITDNLN
jgi:hypothetical protein